MVSEGTTYYDYCVLFYTDDFLTRSTLFQNISVCELYMIPPGLPYINRPLQSSIRFITVTPTVVYTNNLLGFIMDDVVKGSTHGIETVDFEAKNVKDF